MNHPIEVKNNSDYVVYVNGYMCKPEFIRFPGGEWHVKIYNPVTGNRENDVVIHADIRDGEIMKLALLKNAIDELMPHSKITLKLSYLPYARQDRVANKGEAFSLKVFTNLVNSLNFYFVEICDCHSDVGVSLLNNIIHIPPETLFFKKFGEYGMQEKNYDALVAPDAGAMKKVSKIAKLMQLPMFTATKQRDTVTGNISGFSIAEDVKGKRLLIVDDICDGGGTFVGLGKILKQNGAKIVDLYVTHGIFSKGKSLENIDNVFSFYDWSEK